jgi:hypothetical protein
MAKTTTRARKRPAKGKPSEADDRSVEQIAAELMADPEVEAAWNAAYPPRPRASAADLLFDPLDPSLANIGQCRQRALDLFHQILRHHGKPTAQLIFGELANPTAAERTKLRKLYTWSAYTTLGLGLKETARLLHDLNTSSKDRLPLSVSVEAIEKDIMRHPAYVPKRKRRRKP